jgi:hypothetical protein
MAEKLDISAKFCFAIEMALQEKAEDRNSHAIDRIRWRTFKEAKDKAEQNGSDNLPEIEGVMAVVDLENTIQGWAKSSAVIRSLFPIFNRHQQINRHQQNMIYEEVTKELDVPLAFTHTAPDIPVFREVADTFLPGDHSELHTAKTRRRWIAGATVAGAAGVFGLSRAIKYVAGNRYQSSDGENDKNSEATAEVGSETNQDQEKIKESLTSFEKIKRHSELLLLNLGLQGLQLLLLTPIIVSNYGIYRAREKLQPSEDPLLGLNHLIFPTKTETEIEEEMKKLAETYDSGVEQMLVHMTEKHFKDRDKKSPDF